MAYEFGALEATIAAAAGEDPVLLRELRDSFVNSVSRQVDLLSRARCDGNWHVSAMRIRGIAASFHAEALMALAAAALDAAPGEPTVVRRLQGFVAELSTR